MVTISFLQLICLQLLVWILPSMYGMCGAQKRRKLGYSTVKDIQWSEQGLSLLSCGYDCTSRLIDVEKGVETRLFKEDQVVGVAKFHPNNANLFLSGGSKGLIRLWDIRTGNAVNQFFRGLGPILYLDFMNDTRPFISSNDENRSNISENSIIVWDVSREVPLSNQIYVEAYTCPCIRHHPHDSYFVEQSNGIYIAIFSSKPPIKCNFNPDGKSSSLAPQMVAFTSTTPKQAISLRNLKCMNKHA